jgi:hypothetical protein
MSEITNFRQVRQRIYQLSSFEDGLWDILLGTIFMLLAIYPVSRERLGPEWNLLLFLGLLVMLVAAQLVARHYISAPRIGYARLRRTPKLRLIMIFTFVMVLITIGLVAVTFFGAGSKSPTPPAATSSGRSYIVEYIVLLILGLLFSALGYLFGVVRLYFYGWMIGLANLASIYLEHNAGLTFQIPLAVAAGIIILIGFVLLRRFLRKYPVREQSA